MMKTYARPGADFYVKCLRGGRGLPVYSGVYAQRGHGFGGVFRALLRGIIPAVTSAASRTAVKRVAKTAGRHLLNAAVGVASDALKGRATRGSIKRKAIEAGKKTLVSVMATPPSKKRKKTLYKKRKQTKQVHMTRRQPASDIF